MIQEVILELAFPDVCSLIKSFRCLFPNSKLYTTHKHTKSGEKSGFLHIYHLLCGPRTVFSHSNHSSGLLSDLTSPCTPPRHNLC